ncbi:MAG: DNA primase, partial [Oscillospiraceae bacterium]
MSFSADFLNQLKNIADIVDVVNMSGVSLNKAGRQHKGLCPFHSEKSPSFMVYEDTESFYCFGCGKGGDVITYVMYYENLDYVESVKFLSQRYGLSIPDDNLDNKRYDLKSKVHIINKVIARYFFDNLISEEGKNALKYLKGRGLTNDTIKKFGLGYAKDDFNDAIDFLKKQGFTLKEIVESNIGVKSAKGSIYSQFRNRIIFPIIDVSGTVVAFGGRDLGNKGPKYLNSAETLVFNKSSHLFSLNNAKKNCKDNIILTEGYMDAISLYQSGF